MRLEKAVTYHPHLNCRFLISMGFWLLLKKIEKAGRLGPTPSDGRGGAGLAAPDPVPSYRRA